MKGEGKMSDMIDRDATIGALRYECEKLSEFMDKCLATGEYGLRAGAKTERKRIEEDIYILENMPPAQQWTPCSEGMPDEQYSENIGDFKYILCTTIWGDVRPYKYGTPIGGDAPHFWHGPQAMDEKVVAWMYMPGPYTECENG